MNTQYGIHSFSVSVPRVNLWLAAALLRGLFGRGPVMKVNTYSPSKFINRGGQIPAPLHSLKN